MSREKLDKIGPAFVDAKEAARLQPNDRYELNNIMIVMSISAKNGF